jgi:hypothetical protein
MDDEEVGGAIEGVPPRATSVHHRLQRARKLDARERQVFRAAAELVGIPPLVSGEPRPRVVECASDGMPAAGGGHQGASRVAIVVARIAGV